MIGHGPHVLGPQNNVTTGSRSTLGNLLTYGPFSMHEPTNAARRVCDDRPAATSDAELRPTMQVWPGVLERDQTHRAITLSARWIFRNRCARGLDRPGYEARHPIQSPNAHAAEGWTEVCPWMPLLVATAGGVVRPRCLADEDAASAAPDLDSRRRRPVERRLDDAPAALLAWTSGRRRRCRRGSPRPLAAASEQVAGSKRLALMIASRPLPLLGGARTSG